MYDQEVGELCIKPIGKCQRSQGSNIKVNPAIPAFSQQNIHALSYHHEILIGCISESPLSEYFGPVAVGAPGGPGGPLGFPMLPQSWVSG